MATAIGHVREVNGSYFIKSPDGSIKELKVGDTIYEGDMVYGEQGNTDYENIYITLEKDQTDILLTGDESQLFDTSMTITASESETQSVLLSETADDDNINEIETEAGEEVQVPDSSSITTTLFAQHEDNSVDVTADSPEASDGSIIDRATTEIDANRTPIEAATHQAYAEGAYVIDDTITQKSVHPDVIQALQEVQDAADAANIAAQEAQKAALSAEDAAATALSDPSIENIVAAEAAASKAITAAQKASDAALAAKEAVQQTETISHTAEGDIPLAVSNAQDASQSAANASTNATNAAIESEAITDAIMETANTAATTADDVTDASQATADIQEAAAQTAYEVADTNHDIAEAARDAAQIAKDTINDLDDATLTDAEAKGELALDAADTYITEALTAQTAANAYLDAAMQVQTDARSSQVTAQDAYDKSLAANEDTTDEAAALDAATITIDIADVEVLTAATAVDTADIEVVSANALKAEITVIDTTIEAETDAIVDEAYDTAQNTADLAQAAADTAETKAAVADEAKSTADLDLSIAALEAAESAQQEAIDAASTATAAAETAQGALDTYRAMATAADKTLADSTGMETAIINANTAATTAMTAAAESETVTDAEIVSMISDLEELMTTATDAATTADDAATTADDAVNLANGDPTPDNLAAAQTAQAAAILAATTATDAASSTDEAATRLETAAIAADETIPPIITTAHDVAEATDTAAITANAIGNVNLHISTVSDSSVIEDAVDENSTNGIEVGITAHAADIDGQAVTYSIIDDTGQEITDGPFAVDTDSGVVTVRDGSQLDFESAAAHDIIIQSSSEDGSSSSQTFTVDVQNINEGPRALTDGTDVLGDETTGAAAGVTVTGIYRNGSSENILEGIDDELVTSNTHNYFDHGAFGETGYNYMGDHHWFNDHDISLGDTKGGVITFSDGTMGVIDYVSNGYGASESAYVYYNAADGIEIGQAYYEISEDRALQIDVLANDSDVDNDTLTLMDVENPVTDAEGIVIGTAVISGDKIVFTPNAEMGRLGAGESEDVTFTYSVSDGENTDSAVVHINVIGTNDAPVLGDTITFENIDEDNVLHFTEADLLANTSDVDGDSLSVNTLHSENGTITDLGDGNYQFTPDTDYHGDANITFNVNDGHTDVSSSAAFTIDAVNDAPTANENTLQAVEDTTLTINIDDLLSNDSDVDGDTFSLTEVASTDNTHGTVEIVNKVAFEDDFNDDTTDGWNEISFNGADLGNWESSDGKIGQQSNSAKGIFAHEMGEDASSTDYSISVDVDANIGATGNNGVGLVFGHIDSENYFQVSWDDYSTNYDTSLDHKDFNLIQVTDGVKTVLDTVDGAELPNNFNLDVSVDESGITVIVDDNEMLTSSVQPALKTIGLLTYDNDGGSSYDNVTVRADSAGKEIEFTPEPDHSGEASFEYTITDTHGTTDTGTVTLHVNEAPEAPLIETIADATGELDMMVSGTAAANMEIRLYDEETLVGATTSDENGDWNISGDDIIDGMLEGPVSLKAISVEGGFSSPVSNIVNATIHTDDRDTDNSIRSANESIFGGAGNDKLYASEDSDILDGGTGKDILEFARSSEGVSVDLTTNEVSGGSAEGDTISNFESVYGSNYNDTITGTDGVNTIYTRAGDDMIDGGDGADRIIAGEGDDTIAFDADDTIDGGLGFDTLMMSDEIQIDFGAISDKISNIEQLDLGQGSQSVQQLNIEDVLEITPTDDHTLRINGGLGDEVQLNHTDEDSAAEWTKASESIEGEDGHTYDIYTGISGDETVTLQIDQSVTVTDF